MLVDTLQNQVETLQTEIMNVQIKYQKELEKLEKENRDLRQQYLILKTQRKPTTKKIKVKFRMGKFRTKAKNYVFFLEIPDRYVFRSA